MGTEQSNDLNILILGETGVGKSTWINSFANFLKYRTLSKAKNNDLLSLIPSEFTVYDKNFNNVTVTTGKDVNEAGQKGQSATQDARVYTFKFKKSTIRLIDTPGIGDTRGIDQDKKNFENILNTIDGFSVIHGICILLKPNESRVTIMFRFCIKELLAHLHKDAVQNIIFCFTNTRGTSYKPGHTLVTLKELLEKNEINIVSKDTVYCFDSEAYRFLAAVKNNVKFSKEEKTNFEKSWKSSNSETIRLIDYIKCLPPHQVKSTLSLNNMRKTIFKLTKPMAEITRLIQVNKKYLEKEKQNILAVEENIKSLKDKLMVDRVMLELCPLYHLQIVCAHTNCTTLSIHANGNKIINYPQVCDNNCKLSGPGIETVGCVSLLNSSIMQKNQCIKCGHSFRDHLYRYYESIEKITKVEDLGIRSLLNHKLSDKQLKEELIIEKNRQIDEYQKELEQIQDASVKFAYFLQTNAITPYNDEMEEYLEHLIKEENFKVQQGCDSTALKGLEEHTKLQRKIWTPQ